MIYYRDQIVLLTMILPRRSQNYVNTTLEDLAQREATASLCTISFLDIKQQRFMIFIVIIMDTLLFMGARNEQLSKRSNMLAKSVVDHGSSACFFKLKTIRLAENQDNVSGAVYLSVVYCFHELAL